MDLAPGQGSADPQWITSELVVCGQIRQAIGLQDVSGIRCWPANDPGLKKQ